MSLELFYSRAGHLIRRLNQISSAIFLQETSELGLTTVQYAALDIVAQVPEIDQATLSSMIAFDRTTLVKVLDRLEEKGLITRTRSETDRRKILLIATPEAKIILKKIMPMIDRSEKRILAPLSPADRQKFMEMLSQVVRINNVYSRAPLDDELYADVIGRTKTRNKNKAETE